MGLRLGFFYVVVYGSSGGSFLWVFRLGLSVGIGLRYRLLRFWGLQVGLSYGSFGEFRVEE